ncbi:hypothetical protein [Leptothoe spongobia]|uniref:Type I restriction enzyme R protein N-terminal domain-containing protein n=1 Tax=Leptothoe spongobia TAU-MAC 1115 TaxID=1967444 RepID=A0A947GQH3_9CYAN|nr:hypothetical protein [Leptothoe spongobia]MBT9317051.1 hypothetical protein [Leptothoe spongobia TAU-MAC 1115]
MAYSDFTVGKVKQAFGLETIEGQRFLPELSPMDPSQALADFLAEAFPLASLLKSEKAKSELLIAPVLLEVRKLLQRQVSLFSGEEFTVDAQVGLSGICDFVISQSTEQLEIEAPVIVVVEAKKADLNVGMGQCMAEMVAAQRFNQAMERPSKQVYGCVSSGILWRFLQLEGQVVTIDMEDRLLNPLSQLLGILVWMAQP